MNTYRKHSAPTGDEREMLRREIVAQVSEICSRVQDANEEHVDSLLDEAIAAARGKRGDITLNVMPTTDSDANNSRRNNS